VTGLQSFPFSNTIAKQPVKRPNWLFIFPDQFRVPAMGFMNEDSVKTPDIDKLAD
jgi:arylsulfatase A-like enzyme